MKTIIICLTLLGVLCYSGLVNAQQYGGRVQGWTNGDWDYPYREPRPGENFPTSGERFQMKNGPPFTYMRPDGTRGVSPYRDPINTVGSVPWRMRGNLIMQQQQMLQQHWQRQRRPVEIVMPQWMKKQLQAETVKGIVNLSQAIDQMAQPGWVAPSLTQQYPPTGAQLKRINARAKRATTIVRDERWRQQEEEAKEQRRITRERQIKEFKAKRAKKLKQ